MELTRLPGSGLNCCRATLAEPSIHFVLCPKRVCVVGENVWLPEFHQLNFGRKIKIKVPELIQNHQLSLWVFSLCQIPLNSRVLGDNTNGSSLFSNCFCFFVCFAINLERMNSLLIKNSNIFKEKKKWKSASELWRTAACLCWTPRGWRVISSCFQVCYLCLTT